MKNNFQRLKDDEMGRVPDLRDTQRQVRQRIEGMQTIGHVAELYLTKTVDAFIMMTGGGINSSNSNKRSGPSGGSSVG